MLVSRYRSIYRRVCVGSEIEKRRVRESNVVHRRVVGLCAGG